jgi:hypothetical protein
MTERFLTINGSDSSNPGKKTHMIKTYSFTTDDDDASSTVAPVPQISNRQKLLSVNSISVDTANNEDDVPDVAIKVKKRKSRKTVEIEVRIYSRKELLIL